MLKKLIFACFAATLFASCGSDQPVKTDAQSNDPANDGKHFGATIDATNAIAYDELIPKMAATDSLAVKVTGKVGEVCQKKGCWMMLVPEQAGQPEMRVTFKDYAFFMPKDLTGKRVVLEGYAYVDETPVDVLRHYAEDAGKSKEEIEKITEPKREVSYEASGVVIVD
ncbi:MAG TPA: DUF4920 domain-containing protein [Saprospiraceae bacterium]|nr:DUF4920 domain-containing protein [Saprospiraceae bacterium]